MNRNYFTIRPGRLAALILLALTAWPLCAQTNATVNIPDRYLFIVDTSAAMRRRAPAVQKAVENLLRSSMAAQFYRGDTVGVWTFNERLYAGRLPLQSWTPEKSDLITSNVVRFLKAQDYTGASRFESVVPTLRRVVEESPRLTILLVSDGDEPITGTGFDAEIKRALASKFEAQQKARMPFVTVIRAAHGRVASATVNLAPWPVEFPNFPPEPVVVETPKPEAKPKPEPPRPTVPPLIVIGNKRLPPEAATNALLAAATNSALPSTTSVVEPGNGAAAPAATVAPVQTNAPTATDSPTTGLPIQPGKEITTDKPESAPVTVAAPTPGGEPTQPATAVPDPATAESTAAAPANPPTPGTLPAATNPPAEVAVALASDAGSVPWMLIAAGSVPVVLGVGVFFFLQRRARSSDRVSLITRSLDRDQK
jgi:hypothetical protein